MKKLNSRLGWSLALLALLAGPAMADEVITNGVDLWPSTNGMSYSSFIEDPIPAGFFCEGSAAFVGKIDMDGRPIVTDPPGYLGNTDTIVRRLDDARFDDNGVARTRIQLMALSLASAEPVEVGCEQAYHVTASLDGEQPITEMTIVREADWGGSYAAPLHLNVELSFTPVDGGQVLAAAREIKLNAAPGSYWTTTERIGVTGEGEPVRVDTDGDQVADAVMPGPSNFLAGGVLNRVVPVVEQQIQPWIPACARGWCPSSCSHCTPWGQNPDWETGSVGCTHIHQVFCCKPCFVELDQTLLN
ncbi:MAG: hypothetical protein GY719_18870 [bacterium]|nr:hypothetical protein [bacterium]